MVRAPGKRPATPMTAISVPVGDAAWFMDDRHSRTAARPRGLSGIATLVQGAHPRLRARLAFGEGRGFARRIAQESSERTHRGKTKQIDERELALECVAQGHVRLHHEQRVGAKV